MARTRKNSNRQSSTRKSSNVKRSKVICYTGIGSKKSGVHTPSELLNIAKKYKKPGIFGNVCRSWKNNKYICPPDTNVNGWVKHLGAQYRTEKECKKSVAETRANQKKL